MQFSYYPGCTLKNKASDLDRYARACAGALGFELQEIENWQCCGGVYPLGSDEIATKLSSVRALNDAKEKGQDLVTLCSACHHVIKRVNDDMKHVEDIRTRANNYLQLEEPYAGETKVLHYLEVLRDVAGFDKVAEKVVHPLTGKKIGAYYGCLLLRPGKILEFDNPENPKILEDRSGAGDLSVPQRMLRRLRFPEGQRACRKHVHRYHGERKGIRSRNADYGLSTLHVQSQKTDGR